jgi:CRISPR-associated endoribonuclease Cas6
MLASMVITVAPSVETTIPAFTGRAVQAWFLAQVKAHDPALARLLHDGDSPRPYTLSDLIGAGPLQQERRFLSPQRPGWLRVSTLSPDLTALWLERIVPELVGSPVELGGAVLHVTDVAVTPDRHRWAGQISPHELVAAHSLASDTPRRLSIRFTSPTTFRSQGAAVPFPLPDLVFGSLVNRWNAFCPITLHPDARRFAAECVVASKYTLRSQYVNFAQGEHGAAVGCVGVCRYVIRNADRYWGGVMRTLGAFAFFAGVGAHTTIGLGQAALWDEDARIPLILPPPSNERSSRNSAG